MLDLVSQHEGFMPLHVLYYPHSLILVIIYLAKRKKEKKKKGYQVPWIKFNIINELVNVSCDAYKFIFKHYIILFYIICVNKGGNQCN
jgi:hypothetical protein